MSNSNSSADNYLWPTFMAVAVFGAVDSGYLTIEHFRGVVPPCTVDGCKQVLTSQYATWLGLPIALYGIVFYLTVLALAVAALHSRKRRVISLILILTTLGLLSSVYLTYLQLFVLEAICIYCSFSALANLLLWIIAVVLYWKRSSAART